MATEFFHGFGTDIAIKLTPGEKGRLEVYQDGTKIFDRNDEGGKYPGLDRIRELKTVIASNISD